MRRQGPGKGKGTRFMEDLTEEKNDLELEETEGKVRARKKKKGGGGKIWLVMILVCVCVLGFSGYQLMSILLEYKAGTDEYDDLQQYVISEVPEIADTEEGDTEEQEEGEEEPALQHVSFDELKAINENIIAWIEIPDTQISYPVMQGSDNAYYLNHTFRDKVNGAGSIFMETLNASDFTDYHTILYGHNMKNGSMFGSLSEYKSPTYLVAHPYIYVSVEEGMLQYEIFSCYVTKVGSESYTIGFAPDEVYAEYLEMIKGNSLYDTGVEVSVENQILTLSTCEKSGKTSRFVVHAKRI